MAEHTPIADALHEAYMAGFNDAGTQQEPLDEDAFTEAGIALSRMYERDNEPRLRGALEIIRAMTKPDHPNDGIALINRLARNALNSDGDHPGGGCGICGGKLVAIRPRYPKGEPREVCPVCLQDRIEMVRDILNPDTYQAKAARTEATDTGEGG